MKHYPLSKAEYGIYVEQMTARSTSYNVPVTVPLPAATEVERLKDAVRAAAEKCRPGDVVLLSPGGTSYDAFVNFEERGDRFTEWVKALE